MTGGRRFRKTVWIALFTTIVVAAMAWFAIGFINQPKIPPIPHPDPKSFVDKDVQEDIATAAKQVEADPKSAAAWGEYGLVLRAYRQHADADLCFKTASALDPTDGKWPYLYGSHYVDTEPELAVEWLKKAVARNLPSNAQDTVQARLAEALIASGRPKDALASIGPEPKSPRTRLAAARASVAMGDDQAAAESIAELTEYPITAQPALLIEADICRRQGRISYADFLSTRAEATPVLAWPDPLTDPIRSKDHSFGGRLDEAARLLREGRPDQAEQVLKPILNVPSPTDPRPFVGLAEARGAMGDRNGAMKALETAIRIEPKNLAANFQCGLFHFDAGEKLWASGKTEPARDEFREAVVWLDKALAISPDFGKALLLKGSALHRFLGQPDEGLAILRRFVQLRPEAGEGHYLLGQALAESGQTAAATASLRRAMELAPKGDNRAAEALAKLMTPAKK